MSALDMMSSMLGMLSGGSGASAGSNPESGFSMDQFSNLIGQLAGAVAPGTTGARLGQVGSGLAQSNIAAGAAQDQQQQLIDMLSGLTGAGVDTTGVKIGPDGTLQVSGTAAPTTQDVNTEQAGQVAQAVPTALAPVGLTAGGGGNQTVAPFAKLSLSK